MCEDVLLVSLRPAEQIPVKLKVKTVVDEEEYELTTFGHFFKKGQSAYLKYEESMEEGAVKTTVKIKENEVLILRSGAVDMRLHFLLDKTTPGTYQTPLGVLATETETKRIMIEEERIEILYKLSIQGSHAGTYHMNIHYQEVKE